MLWQRVYDSGADSFWNGFAGLFSEFDGGRSQSLAYLGFPDNAAKVREAVKLIKEIRLPDKTAVVIDDYHNINFPCIDHFMEQLAENRIDRLHLILTTRIAKFQRLEELTLKGYLCHITKETFEFAPEEIMAYYRACGITLSESEARRLYAQTEGWISALYLTVLEHAAGSGHSPAVSISSLIEKAVYLPLCEDVKEFLLTLCIFDSFTLKQAFYMRGKEDAGCFLEELTVKNAFIRYDGRLKTYYLHTLFRGFLQEALERKEPGFQQKLYIKAVRWFAENGDYPSARRYYYEGGDFEGLLLTLEEDRAHDYGVSNKDLLKKYLAGCPPEIKTRHHRALLIFAMHLFVHRELDLLRPE